MNEAEEVSQLIGDIYDASLDPALWTGALEKMCDFVGGVASALQSHDSLQQSACFYFSWNDDPAYTKSYLERYVRINPAIVPAAIQTQVGDVSAFLDFISLDEYRATQFYKEWSAPQGYIDAVQATLDKSATSYSAAVVMRHERHGPVDEKARRRMRLLAPHFRRSVAIGKVIDLHKGEAATLADTLDGLAAGIFLVDADAAIVHANISGHAILAKGDILRGQLRGQGRRLPAVNPQADQTLHDVFAAAHAGDDEVGLKGIAVPLSTNGGSRWIAHVLPLTSGARRRAGISCSAVAAVFVRKATLDLPSPLEALTDAYKLTPAELRVLMAIVEIGGVPEVAPVLGISAATVKTHLQRVFEKTGAKRQADLVKLVAGFMSPLGR